MIAASAFVIALLGAAPAAAETSAEAMARRPDAFDAATGYRIDRIRGPTPDDAPGATVVDAAALAAARDAGALLLDVGQDGAGALFDGEWVGHAAHASIPGARWLPGLGRARPGRELQAYVEAALANLLGADRTRPVAVFCVADCWASWNAARRLVGRGHRAVLWYPLGVDGWREAGRRLTPVAPVVARPAD